jgi:hypothetical protein
MNLKSRLFLLLTITVINSQLSLFCQTLAPTKIWKGNSRDDGSVHAIGNGRMVVYENGPDVIKIYPAPYSTPSIFMLELIDSAGIETASAREQGTAIWEHEIFRRGKSIGTIVDFVDSELPCMIRHFKLTERVSFNLKLMDFVEVITKFNPADPDGQKGSMLLMVNAGAKLYQKYVYPKPLFHQIFWQGNAKVKQIGTNKKEYIITIDRGETDLYLSGGPEYPQTALNAEDAQKLSYHKLLERTRIWWKAFTSGRIDFEHKLPANLPQRHKLLQTIDDVSVMIKTQQAQEGSVMAGYPYPLGYVRDQYGVSRGLLALGYFNEAKNIMNFYWNIWRKYGEIHNAQGIGIEGVFHIHENDESETPGYLIVQAFDLLEKTGEDKYLETIFPMLEWCWEVQKKHLVHGMLPFNGDETYVAGRFLPRSALNDGSAEATMLFIDGGEKLLSWIKKQKKWSSQKIEREKILLDKTRNLFRENFWKNGQLVTNNPERVNLTDLPRFRHGVCERSGPDCIVSNKKGFGIDWTERDINNRYQCPACLALGPLPKAEPVIYNLISVSFMPLYMQSPLFKASELRPMVKKVFDKYEKTGILSCNIELKENEISTGTVGYDYGLFLYSMLQTGMENAETIYRKTLTVADSAGVWSEYYNNNIPRRTRYRPWESAINIEALIEYAKQYK